MILSMKEYIPRDIEKKLSALVKTFPAVGLTGPRQSGKSTLLKHLFSDKYLYLTFDDPLVRRRALDDPKLFLSQEKKIILDEIQYLPEILPYIKMEIDNDRQTSSRFIITGSQQFPVIKNLGESLAGRIGLLELLPFSINEVASKFKNKTTLDIFLFSCLNGLYPELLTKKHLSSDWYASYINTYLERDVKSIYDIGSLRDFSKFLQLLASRTGQILNLSTYSNEIGVSVNTLKKWISILEASRIIYLLEPYGENFGKRLSRSPKIYFLDCGTACYLTEVTNKSMILKGNMFGQLFETFCIQETIKIFQSKGKRPSMYYLRTKDGLEIDLILKINNNLYPIEIKSSKTPNISMTSSIEKFISLSKKSNIKKSYLLSLSEESHSLTRNVNLITFKEYITWLKNII